MGQQSQKDELEAVPVIPNWSELCPDLLRCVFKRLSFTNLNRAKLVCSSWNTASRGCAPRDNQIPCLILFPRREAGNNNNNSRSSCMLFVPEDRDNVYITRDLGVEFVKSWCLMTCGSWLLMSNPRWDLYILNPLTSERIDLPNSIIILKGSDQFCFWIDNKTKDYLVVWMKNDSIIFTKKGHNEWHNFPVFDWHQEVVYNHKDQKLYIHYLNDPLTIWDISGDKPCKVGFLDCFRRNYYDFHYYKSLRDTRHLAVTTSGDVLFVACCRLQDYKTWDFRIYKANHMNRGWVRIDSLGDEALILDVGVTVVAKDVQGIKRNSIYFSGMDYAAINNQGNNFVFDLTTEKIEPLPQCVFSSIQFSDARWFFPGFNS
ncbi:putative F-box protein [Cardamine amara subsp. amara]|uniref:F-box protein n=1 Tax=Cardamine amara subsp. amara TaxID=228776 RepID=A0ABD1AUW7_CARAN